MKDIFMSHFNLNVIYDLVEALSITVNITCLCVFSQIHFTTHLHVRHK